jgi:hypothetical protein
MSKASVLVVGQNGGAKDTLKRFNMFSNSRQQRSCPHCLDASVVVLGEFSFY